MEFYDDCAFCREFFGMECQGHAVSTSPAPIPAPAPDTTPGTEASFLVVVDEPPTVYCGFCKYPLLPGEDICYNC